MHIGFNDFGDVGLYLFGRVRVVAHTEASFVVAEQAAARLCMINGLAALKAELGDLDRVVRIVKLQAFVATENGFDKQHLVANAASELLGEVFGDAGVHARTAVGVNQLPMDAAVEIELIAEVD